MSVADMERNWEAYRGEADAPSRHDPYLSQEFPTPLDQAIDAVVTAYRRMSSRERVDWKGHAPFVLQDSRLLLTYAARMATQALREASSDRITQGLIAHLIEGERDDWRENVIVLTLLYDAAKKLGGDPIAAFDKVASLEPDEPASETLRGFRKRKPDVLTIESMGYRTAMTAHGVRYEPDPATWKR